MGKYFQFGNSQNTAMKDDIRQKSITIQCPNCRARFILSTEELAGVNNPRFHCPRCDLIFDDIDANLTQPTSCVSPLPSEVAEQAEQEQTRNPYESLFSNTENVYEVTDEVQYFPDNESSIDKIEEYNSNNEEEDLYSSNDNNYITDEENVSTNDSFDPFADPENPDDVFEYKPLKHSHFKKRTTESESKKELAEQPVTSSSKEKIKAQNSKTKNFIFGSQKSSSTEVFFTDSDSETNSIENKAEKTTEKERSFPNWFGSFKKENNSSEKQETSQTESLPPSKDKISQDFVFDTTSEDILNVQSQSKKQEQEEEDSNQYSFDFGEETNKSKNQYNKKVETLSNPFSFSTERTYREARQEVSKRQEKNTFVSRIQISKSYALTILPLICFLLCLIVVSLHVTFSNEPSIFRVFLPSAPRAIPTELFITDLEIKQFPLQSGEIVHLISGSLENHTTQNFKNIILEGVAFDASGQAIYTKQVNAASTLAKARVESFTPEMIDDFQTQPSLRKYELSANSSQKFAIGIIADEMRAAKFYSARIYKAE